MNPHRTQSKRQDWRTPLYLFNACDYIMGQHGIEPFSLDAAADFTNSLCPRYWDGLTDDADGLLRSWHKSTWCNPPFDKVIAFVDKAIAEAEKGNNSMLCVTSSTENKFFRTAVTSPFCRQVIFLTGRVPFLDPITGKPVSGNPAGTALLRFGPSPLGLGFEVLPALHSPRFVWTSRVDLKFFSDKPRLVS